jgi:hypothetical protein
METDAAIELLGKISTQLEAMTTRLEAIEFAVGYQARKDLHVNDVEAAVAHATESIREGEDLLREAAVTVAANLSADVREHALTP